MGKSKKRIQSYIIDLQNIIGKGAFGDVYICEHEISKKVCVAKVINKTKFDSDPYMKNAFHQEIQIQSSLKHNNIVEYFNQYLSFIEVLQTANNFYIIQEYCQNGTLRNVIFSSIKLLNNNHKLSQADALHCLKCLCLGFTQIAKKGVIHRDLKPQNILIKENQLKIADFGFAKQMMNHRHLTGTTLGTPFYMAPQLLKGQKYSSKCDIWSIGVLYYELLYGVHPWKGNSVHQLVSNIENIELFFDPNVSISQKSQIFLIQALRIKQNDRLTWLQVFEHQIWTLLPQEGNQFKDISMNWRGSYNRAAEKLNELAAKVQFEELIAAFLQLQVSTLSFPLFKKVIFWLLSVEQDDDIGTMYELFDKDCNGVIDFEQFVTSFGFVDGYIETVKILQRILEKGHSFNQMKNQDLFIKAASQLGLNEIFAKNAYQITQSIQF